jgi:hypothetical protein
MGLGLLDVLLLEKELTVQVGEIYRIQINLRIIHDEKAVKGVFLFRLLVVARARDTPAHFT